MLRYRHCLNPCDLERLRFLAPVGDLLAAFYQRLTDGTDCPCCLGARIVAVAAFAASLAATLTYLAST